jgi:hypothetical protein
MHKFALLFAVVTTAVQAQVNAPSGSLNLGQTCSDNKQCKNGAQCYGTTAETILACGNFNAACKDDSQCAYNTCSNGLCSGFLATSSPTAITASITSKVSLVTGAVGSQPSGQNPITALAGSLALGQACSNDKQCMDGAQCYGTTADTIRVCGNFNAACRTDSECAYNTCDNGFCSGFLPSASYHTTMAQATGAANGTAITPTAKYGGGNGTVAKTTGNMMPTGSVEPYVGSAPGQYRIDSIAAILLGLVACFV